MYCIVQIIIDTILLINIADGYIKIIFFVISKNMHAIMCVREEGVIQEIRN